MANSKLKAFHYDMVIEAEDQQQADRVMIERIGYNEDLREYGVSDYTIDASPVGGRDLDPIEVGGDGGDDDNGSPELTPVISSAGPLTSVNGEQYLSILQMNTVLAQNGKLPLAQRTLAREEGIILTYEHKGGWIIVDLDEFGHLVCMDFQSASSLKSESMDGTRLYAQVIDAFMAGGADTGVPAEDRPVIPGFERHGAVAGVNEDEYRSIMRINAAIDGSYTLPSAERLYTGDGTPLLEFAYRRPDGWLHVRVKTDGSFHSADVVRGKDLEDLTSGPLYDSITAALAPEPTA
ncbi:hypothetical protein [Arthrobacter koreensis]|uniref:hypothetical protein n=1 Tax=Arthrobacter koreensis TaxID=199136 RepID=UPI0037F88D16